MSPTCPLQKGGPNLYHVQGVQGQVIITEYNVFPETNCQGLFNQFKLSSVACKAVFNSKDNGKELNFRFHID